MVHKFLFINLFSDSVGTCIISPRDLNLLMAEVIKENIHRQLITLTAENIEDPLASSAAMHDAKLHPVP